MLGASGVIFFFFFPPSLLCLLIKVKATLSSGWSVSKTLVPFEDLVS